MASFCRPLPGGIWETKLPSGFGAYTPCIVEGVIVNISQLVLFCLVCYRIWLLVQGCRLKRFQLKRLYMHGILIFLAAVLMLWPLFKLLLGISIVNLDGEKSFAPFEVLSLALESLTWLSMLCMLSVETRIYVKDFRWFTRFGLIYLLVAQATFFRFIFLLRPFYNRNILMLCAFHIVCQVIFAFLFVLHLPDLVPYTNYVPLLSEEPQDQVDYEALPGKEQTCPEQHANVISRLLFSWMTPLMRQGFKRPLVESDIWQLDQWDQTEQLYRKFQRCWEEECLKERPSLARALNKSLGARFWLGGLFKIGNDASQFVGPTFLSLLLQSMQRGDPAWIGYMYAASIFAGVMGGVVCEGQYFQNVLRVGFRTRATLVAAIFRKTLRMTQEGRKGFTSGRIMNLMTTDAEALQVHIGMDK